MMLGPATVTEATAQLDQHVRDMVQWHFNPDTGCDFWLDFASKLDFDPRTRINGYEDLKLLGHFEDRRLRHSPSREGARREGPVVGPELVAHQALHARDAGHVQGF